MCGICGDIRFNGSSADLSAISRMAETMVPRGPDGGGFYGAQNAAFGHRRLKIIDLSDAARQPMVDSDLGLSIVFNGCIYNYKELREELQQKGYRFFSQGDTEVILKAYHAWGQDAVQRLNGMFAFAIYERDSGRVIVARDRLGIKPFYYSETADGYRFASSLPALLKSGGVDTSIDPVALNHYLSFHAVVPAPRTIFNGVKKLPPATVAVIEPDGSRVETQYWKIQYGTPADCLNYSKEDWMDGTLEVMRRAVKRRLVADVPVGVLLSGGLDSSLIVGLLCEHNHQAVETFSIGFETVNNEAGDEFKYSDIIADRYQTKHHKIQVESRDALEPLLQCISSMSEPMVSHDNIGFYLLSQEVAKHVKVVQSGQGADEIFAGYHWYPPLMQSNDPLGDYAKVFFDRDFAEYCETVTGKYQTAGNEALRFVEQHFAQPGADRAIDKALRLDTTVMLVDDPVKRVDNNTMAASLEARVPFLDHEVVEFAAMVPPELKILEDGKYVLKEAARKVIPAGVIDRPKGYFPVPALKYLRGEFFDLARDSLTNQAARNRGLFNSPYVEKILANPDDHITPLRGSKLWQLALLEIWLQRQFV